MMTTGGNVDVSERDALIAWSALAEPADAVAGVVVDHLGLFEPAALDSSRPALELLARSPNTSIKVSALRALAAAPPPFAALRPLLLTVRDLFGYERMAYGTDWPYAVEQDSYPATLEALDAVFDWDPAERERVTEGTARSLWWREHRS